MPDGVANLAQTRHTTPARLGKTLASPSHLSATESVVPPLSRNDTHNKLVHKGQGFELSPDDRAAHHPPEFDRSLQYRRCTATASEPFDCWPVFDSQEVRGEF